VVESGGRRGFGDRRSSECWAEYRLTFPVELNYKEQVVRTS
jgi:hypothetical protein